MNSQSNFEFIGMLKLDKSDQKVITYRLVFQENNGKISGYSVTDLNGKHETKNSITGTYDKKTKQFDFQEKSIIYTKSEFKESAFCFVNFSGKVKLVQNSSKLEGEFKGLYKNQKKCIDGELILIGTGKINKLLEMANNKIQNSKKVDEKTKKAINPIRMLDSLKINNLSKDQNLNVFWESNTVRIDIWDNGQEDGDVINLFQNGKLILSNYTVRNEKKSINVTLTGDKDTFKIVALNEGKIKPTTAKVKLFDNHRSFDLLATINKDEEVSITIIKNQ